MCVPNFASEQPGETYHCSPPNAFTLGIVDCSDDTMAAHAYFECGGKKGGNNVASLIWKELFRKGLRKGMKVKAIWFFFDNCAGQNKNRMVIRESTVFVELHI